MIDQIKPEDLNRFFTLSPEMFAIIGYDGYFKVLNPAWENCLGFTIEELLSKPVTEFIHHDDLEPSSLDIDCIGKSGEIPSFVNRYKCKDGSYKWLLWIAESYCEEKMIYAAARDVTKYKETETSLKESQRRITTLMNNLPGMAYRQRIDSDWVMEYVSDGALALTGYTPEELIRIYNISFGSLKYHEDIYSTFEEIEKALKAGTPFKVSYRINTANGKIKWVWEQGQGIYAKDGTLIAIEGFITDVTHYMSAQEEQKRLNRALKAITQVNQTIVRAADEISLLNEVLEIICNIDGYRMAWVGYMENDSEKMIRPVAWKGHEDGYMKHIKLSWGNNYMGQGPTGVAIRSRKPAMLHNIERDMPFPSLRQACLERGYMSLFCAPLMENGSPFGVIAIYAGRTDIFNSEEQSLMEQLANDLSFGISNLRARIAREKAEEEKLESENRYRLLVESSPIGIGIQRDFKWIYVNPAAVKIFNAQSADEVIGKEVNAIGNLSETARHMIIERINKIKSGIILEPNEIKGVFNDGREAVVQSNSVPIIYEGEPAILTLLKDVTHEKMAEQKLQDSREELRRLAAHLQAAREEERTYIAREIHDELGQCLTGLKMDVSFLEDLINENQDIKEKKPFVDKIHSTSALIDTTVQSVRKIASELRPVILDSMGLEAAIEWLADDFEKHSGISCECFLTVQDIRLDRDKSTAVFRILQESLTNVMRHANATKVTISLIEEDCNYIMEIRDNGRGITEEDFKKAKSFGLLGMKERAYLLGGSTEIDGKPGKGTTISVTIPINS